MRDVVEHHADFELSIELFEKGQFFSKRTFKKNEIIIGRQPENDIQIAEKAVSRQHAKIVIENNEVTIIDLSSANGTFVDNQKITVQKITSSSMVRIGHQILKVSLMNTIEKNGEQVSQIVHEVQEVPELTLSYIVKKIEESVQDKKQDHAEKIALVQSNLIDQLTQGYVKQDAGKTTGFKLETLVLWNDRIYSMNEFSQKEKIDVGPVKKNAIHIPSLNHQWTLINYDFSEARFVVPQMFPVYVLRGKTFLSQEQLLQEKRIKTDVKSLEVIASAYDVVRVDIDEMTRLYVRYIPVDSDLDRKKMISPDEFVKKAFKYSFIFHFVMAIIIFLVPAEKLKEKPVAKSIDRAARIIVEEKPKEIPKPIELPPEPPKPIEEVKLPEPEVVKPPPPPPIEIKKPPVIVKQKPKLKPKKVTAPPVEQVAEQEAPQKIKQEVVVAPVAPVAPTPQPVPVEKTVPVAVAPPTPAPKAIEPPAPPPPPPAKKVDVNQLGALAALGNMKIDSKSKNSLPADIKISNLSSTNNNSQASAAISTTALAKDSKSEATTNQSGPIRTKGNSSNKSTNFGQESLGSDTGRRGVKAAVLGKPALKFESSNRLEGLSREQVMKTMQASMSKIQSCYERSLLSDANLSGRIEFEWEISAAGAVNSADIKKNSVAGGEQLGDCVLDVIRKIKFPAATNGETTRPSIGFPFGRL